MSHSQFYHGMNPNYDDDYVGNSVYDDDNNDGIDDGDVVVGGIDNDENDDENDNAANSNDDHHYQIMVESEQEQEQEQQHQIQQQQQPHEEQGVIMDDEPDESDEVMEERRRRTTTTATTKMSEEETIMTSLTNPTSAITMMRTTTTARASRGGEPCEARQQMDIFLELQRSARADFKEAQENLRRAEDTYRHSKKAMEEAETSVRRTAEQLVDVLLQEPTRWNENYWKLATYKEKVGHVKRIPTKKERLEHPESVRLGGFVGACRLGLRRPVDHPERIEPYKVIALNRIGFVWEPKDTFWNEMYQELKTYKAKHGNCLVHTGGKNGLSKWCRNMADQYKKFQAGDSTSRITQEQIDKLNEIGFVWNRREKLWKARYEELVAFHSKHGHCFVPVYGEKYKALHRWVTIQRGNYWNYTQGKRPSLTPVQIRLLEDLNFVFGLGMDENSLNRLADLMKYKEEHGNYLVPQVYHYNQKLSDWVHTMRKEYERWKKGESADLNHEMINILNDIGFEWRVTDDTINAKPMVKTWDEGLADYLHNKELINKGEAVVDRDVEAWILEQRRQARLLGEGKPSSITYDKIGRLHCAGFTWEVCDSEPSHKLWEEMFADLVWFNLQHDSYDLSKMDCDLKQWAIQQRSQYTNYQCGVPSLLTYDRLHKLFDVRFVSGFPPKSWEEYFAELMVHRKKRGTFNFWNTDENTALFKWAQKQQKLLDKPRKSKKNSIKAHRIEKLQKVSFALGVTNGPVCEGKTGMVDVELTQKLKRPKKDAILVGTRKSYKLALQSNCTMRDHPASFPPNGIVYPTPPMTYPPYAHPYPPARIYPPPWRSPTVDDVSLTWLPASSTTHIEDEKGAKESHGGQPDKEKVLEEDGQSVIEEKDSTSGEPEKDMPEENRKDLFERDKTDTSEKDVKDISEKDKTEVPESDGTKTSEDDEKSCLSHERKQATASSKTDSTQGATTIPPSVYAMGQPPPFCPQHSMIFPPSPVGYPPYVHPFVPARINAPPWQDQTGSELSSSPPPASSTSRAVDTQKNEYVAIEGQADENESDENGRKDDSEEKAKNVTEGGERVAQGVGEKIPDETGKDISDENGKATPEGEAEKSGQHDKRKNLKQLLASPLPPTSPANSKTDPTRGVMGPPTMLAAPQPAFAMGQISPFAPPPMVMYPPHPMGYPPYMYPFPLSVMYAPPWQNQTEKGVPSGQSPATSKPRTKRKRRPRKAKEGRAIKKKLRKKVDDIVSKEDVKNISKKDETNFVVNEDPGHVSNEDENKDSKRDSERSCTREKDGSNFEESSSNSGQLI